MKLKNIDIKNAFQNMTSEQLQDFSFLSDFIFNKVGIALNAIKLHITSKMDCWGGLLCRQYPDELAKLLVFLYQNKDNINSFCEIGSGSGGTFYVIDSFLRSINANMGKSLSIDIQNHIVRKGFFDRYKAENPQVEYLIIHSRRFIPDQNYDFCLIDGDHSYVGCKKDYLLMSKHSKIIALHDIKLRDDELGVGVYKLWNEIKGNKTELLNEDKRFPIPVGIGVIKI